MYSLQRSDLCTHRGDDLQLVPEFGRQVGDTGHDSVDASLALRMVATVMDRSRPTRRSDHGQHPLSLSGGLRVLAPPVRGNCPLIDIEIALGQALHRPTLRMSLGCLEGID